jgi:serine/threonine protein kinase
MHRDLKPHNILLDRANNDAIIKLADFGLAKYYE